MEKKIFIIGDIHGCFLTFENLLLKLCDFSKDDELYLLGDYIDRGPRVKETLNFILNLQNNGFKINCLMGNHEDSFLRTLESYELTELWRDKNGGEATLNSFKVNSPNRIESKYIDFFRNLPYYFELEQFILAHAGLNTDVKDIFDDFEAMLWTRTKEINLENTFGKKLIVGHTPKSVDEIRKSLKENVIFLDGGCVYSDRNGNLGNLCCLELNSMELIYLKNIDFT